VPGAGPGALVGLATPHHRDPTKSPRGGSTRRSAVLRPDGEHVELDHHMTTSTWKRGDGITTLNVGPSRQPGHTLGALPARVRQCPT
jgi:hypothetical protein